VGDNVDLDDDNDGIADTAENTLGFAPDGDADGDGVPNFLDRNNRGDGMAQTCTDGNNDQRCDSPGVLYDRDGDGVANHLDLDATTTACTTPGRATPASRTPPRATR
jgi:hypothetical protein